MEKRITDAFQDWNKNDSFSGVFSVSTKNRVIVKQACGYRNKAEMLPNTFDTAFGIASGTKLFTGIAVCKLIDENKLSWESKIGQILSCDLGTVNKSITVRQLLTHTSGAGDYIDEESSTSYEEMETLYNTYPVYLWDNLSYYVQMFNKLPEKFTPSERYSYSNTGYVLLGLVIESVTGVSYRQYVFDEIIKPCALARTNFYRMDRLPSNTALGYCYDEKQQEWNTNIFCIPVIGGADGGLFTCASDLDLLWRSIMNCRLLSESMMKQFLTAQVTINEEYGQYYNLGMYQYKKDEMSVYYAIGGDFGVDFFTAYLPHNDIVVSALGNTEINTFPLFIKMIDILCKTK